MWSKQVWVAGAVAVACWSASAQGTSSDAAAIGYVKTVSGEAFVVTEGKSVAAKPGTPLKVRDTIRTGAGASMGITLKDNTVLSFGPATQFVLEEYLFAPAKGDAKLGGRLASGSLHYVSGLIAKTKPDAVTVRTPTGTIGARGTRFVAVVTP